MSDGWEETYRLYDALEAQFPQILMNRMKAFAYVNSQFPSESAANSQSTLSQASATGHENMFEMDGGRRRSRRGYKKQRGGAWTPQMLAALKTILYLLFLHQFITRGGAAATMDVAGRGAGAAVGAIDGAVVGAFTQATTLATRLQTSANQMCANPFSAPPLVAGACAFALRAATETGTLFTSGGAQGPALTMLFGGLVAMYAFIRGLGFVVALPGQAWGVAAAVGRPTIAHAGQVLGGIDGWVDALARVLLDRLFGPNGVNAGVQAKLEDDVQRGPPGPPPPPAGDPGPPGAGAGAGAGATLGGRRRGRGRGRRATKKVTKRRRGTTRKH